jgi:LmbE family N-acetylglucosaminyl deacetylase
MVNQSSASIMTIFAHQDDETFSAGGILAKYEKSYAVSITSDPNRTEEFKRACSILGVQGIVMSNSSISSVNEISIRDELVEILRKYKPDIVITHVEFDYHKEHRLTRRIVEETVEWASHTTSKTRDSHQVSSLWAAETTVLIPSPHIYIDITETNEKRLEAIKCYGSQSHKGGADFYYRFHNTRTMLRGIQADVEHAEAFQQVPISSAGSFKPIKVYSWFPHNP